ncbi:MAG: hypothetical protein WC866_04315 [Patescibacteria group bacterium]
MYKTILVPAYPPEASAWSEHLPHSILIEAEEDGGLLRATMHYAKQLPVTEPLSMHMESWSCDHDANGRILNIEFPHYRAHTVYVSLYNAILVVGAYAERPAALASYHLGLAQLARWLLDYLDAAEDRLRVGLAVPFTSPML